MSILKTHIFRFSRGPAGGLDFEKSCFSVLKGPRGRQNIAYLLDLSLMSMLERLVLKNLTQCTSERLKRPSGAEVMTCSLSLGRSVARSLGRSIARSLDRSLGRSIARSLGRSLARSLARSLGGGISHIFYWRCMHARRCLRQG